MEYAVILLVHYTCKPNCRDAFLKCWDERGIGAKTQAEPGCGRFELFIPRDDGEGNRLLLVEYWKDAEAISRHKTQEHYRVLQEIKGEFIENTVINMLHP